MTAYIANHQKKKNILLKREQELRHALKHQLSNEKLLKVVEKLREAKLNVFKSEFAKNSALPVSSYIPGEEAMKWKSLLSEEIIELYNE